MSAVILVGGGARSGKSAFALRRAAGLGPRRCYVATAEAGDAEMADRIAAHRTARGPGWTTVEAPHDLAGAVAALPAADAAVVDCLTLWLSNRLCRGEPEGAILDALEQVLVRCAERPHPVVIVTNEVGMGIVPEAPLARAFRDLAGRAHQRVALVAAEVWLAALGMLVRLRPGPVVAATAEEDP
jgi:adenosylcobinamide kinase/adenosylcobinamide-phosphate guanylyltransferase